jgi:hypothetical protein
MTKPKRKNSANIVKKVTESTVSFIKDATSFVRNNPIKERERERERANWLYFPRTRTTYKFPVSKRKKI